ncbi:tail fiber domain-containing protein [Pseudomonas sp. GD03842]|uniref:tail fiber domain-containing protein n=1 Tax=Pseudomonas sp. GD03842 TaxID=2975385 RepID=UPI00244AD04B|nr:tail fiber domain-containing protein [Pseudomonas sp. GD03842]MDH0749539.1 tail fiber domain-containing protein [Pseudomonas sp. GD03842]
MPWLRGGTVSVTNGSTAVTGVNTGFDANARVGDAFIGPDGVNYEIANVASPTVISILPAYKGPTVSGAAYAVMPVQGYDKLLRDAFNNLRLQFGDKLAALGTTGNYEILPVAKGGTGGATVADAQTNLGLKGGSNDLLIKSIGFRGAPVGYNVQGLYAGWNGNGDGGANLICNRGSGVGGFSLWSVNADNTASGPVLTYSYDGILTAPTKVVTKEISGLTTALSVAQGGTGAKTAADAATALGLGAAQAPQFAGLELSAAAPYVDFHFNNSTADYSVRMLCESAVLLGITGDFAARSFYCRTGVNGARGNGRFNMNWTGSAMDLYVDASYVGSISLFTSDYRIKKLIKDFSVPSFLDRIDAYRIVTFQKKVFGEVFKGDGTIYQGLIAHEAQAVNPLAVSGEKDGVDEDGNPIIQQLDPIALITDLMGAIKELRAEVNALKASVAPDTV